MSLDPAYARYAGVIARQLAAVQAEDLAAFAMLADERDALAAQLQPPGAHELAALAHAAHLDRALVQALRERRDTLHARLLGEDPATPRVRAYALASSSTSTSTFDVSL